jgi:hypothetical protein
MTPLYLFIYITGDKVTWATARLTRHPTPDEIRVTYRRARQGNEQLFTTLMFDTPEDAEHARPRMAGIIRRKFGIGAASKQRDTKGLSKMKAIVLDEGNDDLCWPNREYVFPKKEV